MPASLITVRDYELAAEQTLDPASLAFYAGGAGDERTLRENLAAFREWHLRPRALVDISGCSTATTVVGHKLDVPFIVAPMSRLRMAHVDGEAGMARAAAAAGTVMCLSFASTSPMSDVAETGAQRWQHIPNLRDRGLAAEFVAKAREEGFTALVLTVDAPLAGNRERAQRLPVEVPKEMRAAALGRDLSTDELQALFKQDCSWGDLEWLVAEARMPVLVKGVLTAEDATLSAEHGAAAVIVSNHGGRQLDGVPPTIDVLSEVVEAVDGRVEVIVDGGIRRGTDIVVALALGARAVLLGRAALWGLVVDGEAGARRVLELLGEELLLAFKLLGTPTPEAVTRAHITRSTR